MNEQMKANRSNLFSKAPGGVPGRFPLQAVLASFVALLLSSTSYAQIPSLQEKIYSIPSAEAADIVYLGRDASGQRVYATVSYAEGRMSFYGIASDGLQGQGFKVDYHKGQNLGTRIKTEYLDSLNMPMGNASPSEGVPRDDFSIRATGILRVERSGNYTFLTRSDDGVRLYIDGKMIIDQWKPMGTTEFRATAHLMAGRNYRVQLEYFERGGPGHLELLWLRPGSDSPAHLTTSGRVAPSSFLVRENEGLQGPFQAEYFQGRSFETSRLSREESQIDHDFNRSSPGGSVPRTDFSARWKGKLKIQTEGLYRFYTTSDDGVRLRVNGETIIDEWRGMAPTEHSGEIELDPARGDTIDIEMEYFQGGGGASIKLEWEGPRSARRLLRPAGGFGALKAESEQTFVRRILALPYDLSPDLKKGQSIPFAIISGGITSDLNLFEISSDGVLQKRNSYQGSNGLQAILQKEGILLHDTGGLFLLPFSSAGEAEPLRTEEEEPVGLCTGRTAIFPEEIYGGQESISLKGVLEGKRVFAGACLKNSYLLGSPSGLMIVRQNGDRVQIVKKAKLPDRMDMEQISGAPLQILDGDSMRFAFGSGIYQWKGDNVELLYSAKGPMRCAAGPVSVCLDSNAGKLLQLP